MAGHSHWANIAAKKGATDKKRGKLFGKLSRAIIVAARNGGGDPVMNLPLRYAIDKAKAASMPKETIDRAVKKGTGDLDGENYEEIIYEGYGPGGTAVLCDILTDNRHRTASQMRKIFELHGGNLGGTNCVAWMFDRKGIFEIPEANLSEERLLEIALEAGAEDVRREEELFILTCEPETFGDVADALDAADIERTYSDVARMPRNRVDLSETEGRQLLKLIDALEDQDDVQNVITNSNLPEPLVAELTADAES